MSAECVQLSRSFIMNHQGATSMSICTTMPAGDQEAPHQSLYSDTNLASATLWLLFKLVCT